MRRHDRAPLLLLLALALGALPGRAVAQADSSGVIVGVVTDSGGASLAGAEVRLAGGAGAVWSADRGHFRLARVPAGRGELRIRRLGFCPDTLPVVVAPADTTRVTVALARCAPTLAPVVVRASASRYTGRLAGFNERRDRGIGRYITRADIERLRPSHTSDVLRTVPGVRVVTRDNPTADSPRRPDRRAVLAGRPPDPTVFDLTTRSRIRLRGASCPPQFFLNGARLAQYPEVDLDSFEPNAIEGIEVYAGGASIPPQFSVPGTPDGDSSRCGAVVVWTSAGERHDSTPLQADAAAELVRLIETAQVYTADEVDVRATLDTAASPSPTWDDSLRASGTSGRVVVELVVDAEGDPELATLSIVSANHPALIPAVRRAVADSHFTPARRRGRPVRQLVQQPYDFVAEPPPGR